MFTNFFRDGLKQKRTRLGLKSLLVLTALVVGVTSSLAWAIQSPSLEVTVTYAGSDGEVSSENSLYVVIFDTASMMQASPVAQAIITENGGTVSFSNLTASPVYVAAFYDTHGTATVGGAAPPSGSPANQYAQAGSYVAAPIALVAGETVAVSVQITDFFRMP